MVDRIRETIAVVLYIISISLFFLVIYQIFIAKPNKGTLDLQNYIPVVLMITIFSILLFINAYGLWYKRKFIFYLYPCVLVLYVLSVLYILLVQNDTLSMDNLIDYIISIFIFIIIPIAIQIYIIYLKRRKLI